MKGEYKIDYDAGVYTANDVDALVLMMYEDEIRQVLKGQGSFIYFEEDAMVLIHGDIINPDVRDLRDYDEVAKQISEQIYKDEIAGILYGDRDDYIRRKKQIKQQRYIRSLDRAKKYVKKQENRANATNLDNSEGLGTTGGSKKRL